MFYMQQHGRLPSRFALQSFVIHEFFKHILENAHQVVQNMSKYTEVSHVASLQGYADGDSARGLQVCKRMQEEGIELDVIFPFACAFKTCACVEQVQLLHNYLIDYGLDTNIHTESALIDLYAKCGSLQDAVTHFEMLSNPNVFAWNILTSGYVEHECGHDALRSYEKMQQAGIIPNDATYVHVLGACGNIGALKKGKLIHADIKREEIESQPLIRDALIDMYAECASLEDALKIFEEVPHECTVTSWCAIIGRCVECGQIHETLQLFKKMQEEGVQPDEATYVCTLQACRGNVAGLDVGRHIHVNAVKQGYELVEEVSISLLGMYVNCGKAEEAKHFFHGFPNLNSAFWCVMIAGCAQQGDVHAALQYFKHMNYKDSKPSDASFSNILLACNNAGLAELGSAFFKSMMSEFGMLPAMEHYVCMVDSLGRIGLLKEAEDLILRMPHIPDTMIWVSLLGVCAKYSNLDVGERAFACFVSCNPKIGAGYKLMASIYAANRKWEKVEQVHKMLAC